MSSPKETRAVDMFAFQLASFYGPTQVIYARRSNGRSSANELGSQGVLL